MFNLLNNLLAFLKILVKITIRFLIWVKKPLVLFFRKANYIIFVDKEWFFKTPSFIKTFKKTKGEFKEEVILLSNFSFKNSISTKKTNLDLNFNDFILLVEDWYTFIYLLKKFVKLFIIKFLKLKISNITIKIQKKLNEIKQDQDFLNLKKVFFFLEKEFIFFLNQQWRFFLKKNSAFFFLIIKQYFVYKKNRITYMCVFFKTYFNLNKTSFFFSKIKNKLDLFFNNINLNLFFVKLTLLTSKHNYNFYFEKFLEAYVTLLLNLLLIN